MNILNRRLYAHLSASPKRRISAYAVVLTALIGAADWQFASPDIYFGVFYLVPISLAAWFAGLRAGIVFAVLGALAAGVSKTVDVPDVLHRSVAAWNTLSLLLIFLLVAFTLHTLRRTLEKEKNMARTDYLTGAVNGRHFLELLGAEMTRTRRYKAPMSLLYIDLDNFKTLNDSLGHSAGDLLLRTVRATAEGSIRSIDVFGRLGGDEFGVLLPNSGLEQAEVVARRLRRVLLEAMKKNGWAVTFSIGIVVYTGAEATVDELVSLADNVMYMVKNHGKDGIKHQVL